MKHSQFWSAMDAAFGNRAGSVCSDLVLASLGHRTPEAALAAGQSPREVWAAICDAHELPDQLRWHHRRQPERRP